MDNVIHAFGSTAPNERRERMLELLDEAKQNVERGAVTSLAITMYVDGGIQTIYSTDCWSDMLAAITRFSYLLQKDIDNERP